LGETATPHESIRRDGQPNEVTRPTGAWGAPSGTSPIFAMLIGLAFAGLVAFAAGSQHRRISR
jgi:hypothetical protein